jgi:hypothetical protein
VLLCLPLIFKVGILWVVPACLRAGMATGGPIDSSEDDVSYQTGHFLQLLAMINPIR